MFKKVYLNLSRTTLKDLSKKSINYLTILVLLKKKEMNILKTIEMIKKACNSNIYKNVVIKLFGDIVKAIK